MTNLSQQVADYLAQNPNAITLEIAEQLQQPEGHILISLPKSFVKLFDASRAEEIYGR